MSRIEDLPCTDLKCVWSARKTNVQEEFAPAPIHTFCCASREEAYTVTKKRCVKLTSKTVQFKS